MAKPNIAQHIPTTLCLFSACLLQACGGGSSYSSGASNSAPVFDSASVTLSLNENSPLDFEASARDNDIGDTVTYSLSGDDAALFTIATRSGELSANNPLDFEGRNDSNGDNQYQLTLIATDSRGARASQNLSITLQDVNEAPTLSTQSNYQFSEGEATKIAVNASDPDAGDTLQYQIKAGADAALFTLVTEGENTYLQGNFTSSLASPQDADSNNIYQVTLSVTDSAELSAEMALSIEITANILSWQRDVFPDASRYANLCANPREGNDPATGRPYPDKPGSVAHENFFLRSLVNDMYLWYDEIEDKDPNSFNSTGDYYAQLKTTATTASGANKDRFHFRQETLVRNNAQNGRTTAFGLRFKTFSAEPPRDVRVRDVVPNSPADNAGIVRGMSLLAVNDLDLINAENLDAINLALSGSNEAGKQVALTLALPEQTPQRFDLSSREIQNSPVRPLQILDLGNETVAYLHFNSFIRPAERGLFDAFTTMANSNIDDLILDLRYNGGGLVGLSAQLAYMIAGPEQTEGKVYSQRRFNDKYPNTNPATGGAITPTQFIPNTLGWSRELLGAGQDLPTVALSRVFVLTTANTCSASEGLINGLRGIDVEVIIIGDKTCGKPFGFYPQSNCGYTYSFTNYQSTNHKGFGGYEEGFAPENGEFLAGETLPGCLVEDTARFAFGDVNEPLVSAALRYRSEQSCPDIPPPDTATTLQKAAAANKGQRLVMPATTPGLFGDPVF